MAFDRQIATRQFNPKKEPQMPAPRKSTEIPGETTAEALNSPLSLGATALQAWMDMGTEAIRFLSERLQQDIATQEALLACTNLDEMRKIQTDFFKSTHAQYTSEARKMQDMMVKAATGGLTTLPNRRYDDIPL